MRKPVTTSSKIRTTPRARVSSRSARRNAGVVGARYALADQLGPADFELAARAIVEAPGHLVGDRADDRWVIVPEDQGAVAAPAVEVGVAVHVPLAGAVGALDVEGEGRDRAAC